MRPSEPGWKNWGDHPVVVLIGLIVALIAIFTFFTGKPDLPSVLSSNTSMSSGVIIPTIKTQPTTIPTDQKLSDNPPSTTLRPISFSISANQTWQDTGIRLNDGDTISIRYLSGGWDWTRDYPDFDATGDPDPQNTCERISHLVAPGAKPGICPIPDGQIGALVGKIADNDPFLVTNVLNYTVPQNIGTDQTLYLMINDVFNGLRDNDGEIRVTIIVSRR